VEAAVQKAVENDTAGDPCSASKWIRQSLRCLEIKLASIGVLLSHMSIRRLLKQQKYSLKANRKSGSRLPSTLSATNNFATFADETKILILSDSGGSNGYRVRNWKYQLQQQLRLASSNSGFRD
jgi:Rhodopirellula transposase DDE domain